MVAACSVREREGGSGPVRLQFWTLALAPFEGYIRERLAAFEAAHPGVEVEWVDVPFEAIDRKLIAAAAAKRAPDVVNLSDRTFARFAGLGAMVDLRPLTPGDPAAAYTPGALRVGEIEGKTLALPWYLSTQVGMLNEALIVEGGVIAGVDAVATDWRGLMAQARAYHAKTGKYLFSLSLGEESQIPMLLFGEGLPPLVPDADGGVRADLTRAEVVEYVSAWVSLYRDGALPAEAATRDHAHLTEMYQNRRLAMIDSGPSFLKRVKDVSPSVYEVTRVRPATTGRLGRAHVATMVLGVTNQSRHPREAAALAWFMTTSQSQRGFMRVAPILSSAAADVGFIESPPGEDPKVTQGRGIAAGQVASAVAFTPSLAVWPDLRRSFEDGMKRLLLSDGDVAQALAGIEGEWNRILRAGGRASPDALPTPGPLGPGGAGSGEASGGGGA